MVTFPHLELVIASSINLIARSYWLWFNERFYSDQVTTYQFHKSPLNNQVDARWRRTSYVFVTRFKSFFDTKFALRLLSKFCLDIPDSPPPGCNSVFYVKRQVVQNVNDSWLLFYNTQCKLESMAGKIIHATQKDSLSINMSLDSL